MLKAKSYKYNPSTTNWRESATWDYVLIKTGEFNHQVKDRKRKIRSLPQTESRVRSEAQREAGRKYIEARELRKELLYDVASIERENSVAHRNLYAITLTMNLKRDVSEILSRVMQWRDAVDKHFLGGKFKNKKDRRMVVVWAVAESGAASGFIHVHGIISLPEPRKTTVRAFKDVALRIWTYLCPSGGFYLGGRKECKKKGTGVTHWKECGEEPLSEILDWATYCLPQNTLFKPLIGMIRLNHIREFPGLSLLNDSCGNRTRWLD